MIQGIDWVNMFAIVVILGISVVELCWAWKWFHGEKWEHAYAWFILFMAFGLNGAMIAVNLVFILK